ncbi:class I SAM-dependent methyltransferase [Streptomyces sp. NPDC014894]|uniref:class I SAM-dependent methyltransferase n=1 Tax=Streptomyces sp. NPDC014894 TaxID=3364931 RepID=UPI0036F85282
MKRMGETTRTYTEPQPGVQWYYEQYAQALADRYEALTFDGLYEEILPLLPAPPARVADIGAGTGRDAAALARLGHRVTAVEPVREMRTVGARLHPEPVEWVADALPELGRVDGPFELLLLSAVWMHLDEDERPFAMERVSALLTGGGRLVVTLRHGAPPRDRRMFDVSADETVALAARHGLREVYRAGDGADRLGRNGVHWSQLVFEKPETPDDQEKPETPEMGAPDGD